MPTTPDASTVPFGFAVSDAEVDALRDEVARDGRVDEAGNEHGFGADGAKIRGDFFAELLLQAEAEEVG